MGTLQTAKILTFHRKGANVDKNGNHIIFIF